MLATKAQIIEAAKALPEDERVEVIAELQATMPFFPNGMTHDEFSAEFERRWQEHLANPAAARPAEEVIEEIRRKHRAHG